MVERGASAGPAVQRPYVMSRRRTGILVVVGAVVLVAAVVTTVYALIGNPLDPFDNRSFTPAAWRTADRDGRARMCRDLVSRHLIAGTAEPQVVALLGKPAGVYKAGERDHLVGAQTYVYSIGNWSFQGMDDAFLYVHLDANGRVIYGEIYGY